jgi:integrase
MVELLALTGQRRGEVAGMLWSELDPGLRTWTISSSRTKNNKQHIVHLSEPARALLAASPRCGPLVFSADDKRFNSFNHQKSRLDSLSGVSGWVLHDLRRTVVSGMARLGIAPHVADKILNHQSGTISGVAAVYQRHEFMAERKEALERWASHAVSVCAPVPAIHAASGFLQDLTN